MAATLQRQREQTPFRRWSLVAAAALFAFQRSRDDRDRERGAGAVGSRPAARSAAARGSDGRGRTASAPQQIPAKGWKDILIRVYHAIDEDRVLAVAAGVTYYVLLALFPAIAALISIYGLFADPATIQQQVQSLSGLLPGGAISVIRDQAMRVAEQDSGNLTLAFIVGVLIALWSANSGIKAVFDALNVAYGEREKRNFFRLNGQSLLFTIGAIVFLILALIAVAAIPVLLKTISFGPVLDEAISILRWPVMLALVGIGLAVLFRYGPSRDRPQWRWVTWGSAFASVGWLAFSLLFTWYVANFGSYNKTYGSLGAVIGFMVWIWLSMTIVLMGAELDAEMEHQTARDTTEGRAAPMGQRGAKMADTIGEAQD